MRSPSRSPCRETRCRATDGSPRRGCRRHLHRRGAHRGRRAADGQGANRGAPGGVGAGRSGSDRRRAARAVHARDDGRDQRAPGAEGRTDGVRLDGGLRAPPAPAAPGPGTPLPALRAAPRAARADRATASASASGWGRTASSRHSTWAPSQSSTPRRSQSACCSPSGIRATSAPWPQRSRVGCPRLTSLLRTRSRRSSGNTSGPRRRRRTRTSARGSETTCARSATVAPRPGCRSRS